MERIQPDRRVLERCRYVVIDSAHVDSDLRNRLPVESLAPQAYVDRASQLPYFLQLGALGAGERADFLDEILDHGSAIAEPPLVSLLIESSHTPGSVIRHLQRMMVVRSPIERKLYQLRYHDAYTLMQLCWILSEDQQKTLVGPSSAWIFPLEHWWRLRPEGTTAVTPALRLGNEQWYQLQLVGTINLILARQGVPVEQRTARGRQLYPGLATAGSLGLTDEEDLIDFAVRSIVCHPEFHRHRAITQILEQCKGQPRRYSRLTSALSDADWQRIAADMSAAAE